MLYFASLFLLPLVVLTIVCLFLGNFYKAAGHEGKERIPFLNVFHLLQITGKGRSWLILLIIPVINLLSAITLLIDLLKAFGYVAFSYDLLAIFAGPVYLPFLNFSQGDKLKYIGPGGVKPGQPAKRKSHGREWADAIIYAVVAATLIRTFIFEAYTIPTTSMEGSLLAGDFLFVSKFHYGARVPMTPIAFPFAHHTMPVIGGKAYSELIQWDYKRLPALQEIKRNDIVVFNFPAGDTLTEEYQSEITYYQILRDPGVQYNRELVNRQFTVSTRPVDKRENYIKRCVAVPGDSLFVLNGNAMVNGEVYRPEHMQYSYKFEASDFANPREVDELVGFLRDECEVNTGQNELSYQRDGNRYFFRVHAKPDLAGRVTRSKHVKMSERNMYPRKKRPDSDMYPNSVEGNTFTVDNFGPVWVPKKGETIQLTEENIKWYLRCITAYEGNQVEMKGGKLIINGAEAKEYTFKQNYYFMMGDNRHNSQDSRFWGFVPEDHIVGKAWLIWFSVDKNADSIFKKIRFNRLFSGIHKNYM